MSTGDKPSWRTPDEWIDAAWTTDSLLCALLAVATAARDEMAYCPLPPGYQAVYACSDGSLTAEAIVALSTNREREHEPVVFRPGEGFTTLEARPDWYLAPGETLNDARAGIRERDEDRARYLAERGKPAR